MITTWANCVAKAICVAAAGLSLSTIALAQTPQTFQVRDCRTSFIDRVTFSCERTGVLVEVPEEGDRIEADEIVVRLNDAVPQANLAAAKARALVSEVEIGVAAKTAEAAALEHDAAVEANRTTSSSNPAFPPTHIGRLRLNHEASKLQVEQREREKEVNELAAEQAQAELETYWITSHLNGIVTKVLKHRGEGAQLGESIIEVVNTDRLRVEGYVSVEDSNRIEVGMPVKVSYLGLGESDSSPDRVFDGQLGFVDVSVQPLSKKVRVWAEIDNSQGWLREGLEAKMEIVAEPVERVELPPPSQDAAN